MNQLLEWLSRLLGSWKFWVVVPPWDIGVRVRLGKKATALAPGIHFRIPFIDDVVLINTRLRICTTPPVTVQPAHADYPRILTASIGYNVQNPLIAMLRFEHPHIAVAAYAQTEIAKLTSIEECRESLINFFTEHGINIEWVRFIEDVEVQTIRLLQDSWRLQSSEMWTGTPSSLQPRY